MIAVLRGTYVDIVAGEAVVDVNGVGYAVRVPATFTADRGSVVKLYIDTVVREDSITLFGFGDPSEKMVFRKLYSVSGVGPKTALGIISFFSVQELVRVISSKDVSLLSKVPGIGKKTAERIIIELRDKLGTVTSGDTVSFAGEERSTYDELVEALVGFGYKRNEAVDALKPRLNDINGGRKVEEILRETLRSMA